MIYKGAPLKNILFLDTEFSDFIDTALLSIGLVSLDGTCSFYRERSDWQKEGKASPFVYENVLPLFTEKQLSTKVEIASELHKWLVSQGNSIIAIDYYGDWQLLCDLLADYNWPSNIHRAPLNINSVMHSSEFQLTFLDYFKKHNLKQHHALYDANANRAGWLATPSKYKQEFLTLLCD